MVLAMIAQALMAAARLSESLAFLSGLAASFLFTDLVMLAFNLGLRRGHNWVRITFIVMVVVTVLQLGYQIHLSGLVLNGVTVFNYLCNAAGLSACVLLLTPPAREWFLAMKRSRQ
jgi:hypothetical protein